jgi:hypothetical protein
MLNVILGYKVCADLALLGGTNPVSHDKTPSTRTRL